MLSFKGFVSTDLIHSKQVLFIKKLREAIVVYLNQVTPPTTTPSSPYDSFMPLPFGIVSVRFFMPKPYPYRPSGRRPLVPNNILRGHERQAGAEDRSLLVLRLLWEHVAVFRGGEEHKQPRREMFTGSCRCVLLSLGCKGQGRNAKISPRDVSHCLPARVYTRANQRLLPSRDELAQVANFPLYLQPPRVRTVHSCEYSLFMCYQHTLQPSSLFLLTPNPFGL